MIRKIQNKINLLDGNTKEVLNKSMASTVVKISGMIMGVFVSIFLGRTLGAEGLGIINLSNQIVSIVLIICLLGMRQVVLKEVAIGYNRNDQNHISNTMRTAYILNGSFTLIVSILLISLSPLISKYIFNETRLTIPLIIAFIVLTPQVFSRIFSSGLIGFKKIWQSNLADQTLSYAVISLMLIFLWLIDYQITIISVAIIFGISRIVVMLSLGLYWRSLMAKIDSFIYIGRQMLKTAMPLLVVSTSVVIGANSSIIILGFFEDMVNVGIYSVASSIAILTSFFLLITNSAISPNIAALYANKEIKNLEIMVQQVTKGLGFIGFIALIFFIAFGKIILGFWGTEFIDAYWILVVLSIGQFFNIATGASGLLLVMTGLEKIQSKITTIFLLINIVLNIGLIFVWGILGAAIATSISLAGENIVKVIYAKKMLGIATLRF